MNECTAGLHTGGPGSQAFQHQTFSTLVLHRLHRPHHNKRCNGLKQGSVPSTDFFSYDLFSGRRAFKFSGTEENSDRFCVINRKTKCLMLHLHQSFIISKSTLDINFSTRCPRAGSVSPQYACNASLTCSLSPQADRLEKHDPSSVQKRIRFPLRRV